jgi:hypothetical protein
MGIAPVQSEFFVQSGPTHFFVVVSQMGVVFAQLPFVVHWTHVFVPGLSQTGTSFGHCALVVQFATHVFVVSSHTGVAPPHCVVSKHCTHFFVVGLQRAVAPLQSAFVVQFPEQVWATGSQIGASPGQAELCKH